MGWLMRFGLTLVVAALVAGGCGGDDGNDDTATTDDSPTTDAERDALATAVTIDTAVDLRIVDTDTFTPLGEPTDVAEGDVIRTDTTGFAEITYFNGSITRLDIDTDFTVIELDDTPDTAIIRTQMGLGRTWHRVSELTGDDTYQVQTAVATAVVRGTAFIITCTDTPVDTCTFEVLDGTVDIDIDNDDNDDTVTIDTGQTLTVRADDTTTPQPDTGTTTDPWITRNLDLDTAAGLDPLDPDTSGTGDGDASGDDQVAEFTVTVSGTQDPGIPPTFDFRATLRLRGSCDGTGPCEMTMLANDGPLGGQSLWGPGHPLEPTGEGYTYAATFESAPDGTVCAGGTTQSQGTLTLGPEGPSGSWNATITGGPCAGSGDFTFDTFEPAGPGGEAENVTCVMNGTAGANQAWTFVDEPVQRVPSSGPSGAGFAYVYGQPGDPLNLSVGANSVTFFESDASLGATSISDGGTYDFAPDGSGATVIDERGASLDYPALTVDVVITCEAEGN